MSVADHVDLEQFMAGVERRNPGETEFIQAVREVAEDIYDFMEDKVHYHEAQILRRIAEPDRVISFPSTIASPFVNNIIGVSFL